MFECPSAPRGLSNPRLGPNRRLYECIKEPTELPAGGSSSSQTPSKKPGCVQETGVVSTTPVSGHLSASTLASLLN